MLENGKIGVLVRTKSWLSCEIPNDVIRVEDYKVYSHDRLRKKKGGGLCAYIHKKMKVNALTYSHLNYSDNNL